jgi:hypothetical protein
MVMENRMHQFSFRCWKQKSMDKTLTIGWMIGSK